MATEIIEITKGGVEIIEVIERGPAGPAGAGLETLTTQGDILYQGLSSGQRLPIGTAGQILKVNSGATAPEWGEAPATGVTSVAVSGSDGIEVDSGSPITSSGTIALGVNAATLRSHINVADGAEVNVNADWNSVSGDSQILNKPTLATVATSGSYADLTNVPTTFTPSSHTHTTSDITSGTLAHEHGGLEADVSAYDGLVQVSSGTTSSVKVAQGGVVGGTSYPDLANSVALRNSSGDTLFNKVNTVNGFYAWRDSAGQTEAGNSFTGSGLNLGSDDSSQSPYYDGNLVNFYDSWNVGSSSYNGTQSAITVNTANLANRTFTFPSSGGELVVSGHTHATAVADPAGSAGFLSSADKQKLDGIATSANNYTHPNHTGDVTSSGDGATTIANSAVTYAKIQNVTATDKLLGRSTAGAGVVEEIACTSAGRALIDDADASAQRTTLGLGTAATSAVADFVAEATATTKGDILARSASAIIRLGVGADGTVLTADSAEATGVKWAAASGGGFGEVRFDTSGSYTYTGQAAEGSSESSAVWFIRRSEYSTAGAYVSTTTANNVEWDDRLTASYT